MVGWVDVSGDVLLVRPSTLVGELPYLVVNLDTGASIELTTRQDRSLEGGAGDRVCASRIVGGTATASNCTTVE